MKLYQVPEGLRGALSGVSVIETLVANGVLETVETEGSFLWCFTHWRIPEDGTDLCGDEWREIGPCDFGTALIVRAGVGEETT